MSECRNCGYTMQVDELETEITHLKKLLKEAVPFMKSVNGRVDLRTGIYRKLKVWTEEVEELK